MLSHVVLLLLGAVALSAGAGPTCIRRINFEPRSEKADLGIRPGSAMNESGAEALAESLRRQLAASGYREASIRTELLPAGPELVDLQIRVDRGPRYKIRRVRFTGRPVFSEKELKRSLRPWHGVYTDAAIGDDLRKLESLYVSRGYFDALVKLADVRRAGSDITLTFSIEAGPAYEVSGGSLCPCLRQAWREAMRRGQLDVDSRLELTREDGRVWVAARTDPGRSYTVGRIEFRGNHHFGDLTMRGALALEEGGVLDWERLRRSVVRLNRLNLFEPLTDADVQIERDEAGRANIVFQLREKPRGRWYLAGPAAPPMIAGPAQASIVSRLPAWGRGVAETSTWFASVSLLAFSRPLATLLPLVPQQSRFLPLVGISRPLLPGQGWLSGIYYSPQMGLRAAGASYGMAQSNRLVRMLLRADTPPPQPLLVRVEWSDGKPANAATLICAARKWNWSKVRGVAAMASDWLLGSPLF